MLHSAEWVAKPLTLISNWLLVWLLGVVQMCCPCLSKNGEADLELHFLKQDHTVHVYSHWVKVDYIWLIIVIEDPMPKKHSCHYWEETSGFGVTLHSFRMQLQYAMMIMAFEVCRNFFSTRAPCLQMDGVSFLWITIFLVGTQRKLDSHLKCKLVEPISCIW